VTSRPPSPRIIAACALLAASGLGGLLARPAAAADWTVETAANQFGAGRKSFGYTVNPGGQVADGIVVSNHGAAPLRLVVRADGRGVGAWVRPGERDVTVEPGESTAVPFVLTLPKDAKAGDYAGRIAGIPIRLRVSGAIKPRLSVEDVRVHYSEAIGKGDATVSYTIRNTGNALLSADQAVSLSGPFGLGEVASGRIARTPPLLPGDTRRMSVPLRAVTPALRLTATVTLIPLMTDAAGSTAPLAATKTAGHALVVPWSLIAVVVVLCGLALALRRRRRSPAAGT
jgi:uncharacterized membrane protein